MNWEKIDIETESGRHEAIAPEIISASRATDIPAFYAGWFFDALDRGYCTWTNPFNQNRQYVSFARMKAVVFWSKNPAPILPYLDRLDRRGIAYYFQFTVNDYAPFHGGRLERNVPALDARVDTFRALSTRLGSHRVIWRSDPLILTDAITEAELIESVRRVGDRLHPLTRKIVFSFADIAGYAKVRNKLGRAGIAGREPDEAERVRLAGSIARMAKEWGIEAATCAEGIDLEHLGISHNRCMDDELLLRISRDEGLAARLGRKPKSGQLVMFGDDESGWPELLADERKAIKDKGQRKECGCVVSKDIGRYNTCPHSCAYCYANTSDEIPCNHDLG